MIKSQSAPPPEIGLSLADVPPRATLAAVQLRVDTLRSSWSTARPFHWVVVDDFLPREFAERLLLEFPAATSPLWARTNYVHQKKKLTLSRDLPPAHAEFFRIVNDPSFIQQVSDFTSIPGLLPDAALVGGGLHQSLPGAFLDVHVDYNYHPRTRWHRRLNLLVYLNKEWRPEYEGYLELWDMGRGQRLTEIAPIFNRAVVFETNDISYHGHPVPLATPEGVTRKSLAAYYFSETRGDGREGPESNTKYRQTSGPAGYAKTARSSFEAARDRLREEGIRKTAARVTGKMVRRLLGKPPMNG